MTPEEREKAIEAIENLRCESAELVDAALAALSPAEPPSLGFAYRVETYLGDGKHQIRAFYATVEEAREVAVAFQSQGERSTYTRVSLDEALRFANAALSPAEPVREGAFGFSIEGKDFVAEPAPGHRSSKGRASRDCRDGQECG